VNIASSGWVIRSESCRALERGQQLALAKRVALGEMGVMTVGRC
jgi:hypothetical protein